MFKALKGTLIASFLFVLVSCFQVETVIHVEADGSGKVVETVLFTPDFMEMMAGMKSMGKSMQNPENSEDAPTKEEATAELLEEMIKDEKISAKASTMGEGVSFEKVEKIQSEDGKVGYRATYAYQDINELELSMNTKPTGVEKPSMGKGPRGPRGTGMGNGPDQDTGKASASDDDARQKDDQPSKDRFHFAYDRESKQLSIFMPRNDEKSAVKSGQKLKDKKTASQQRQPIPPMMKSLFKDMEIGYYIRFANGIEKTNASFADKDSITLMKVNFGSIMEHQGAMNDLQQAEDDPEVFQKLAKKISGLKVETQEKVDVQLK